MQNPDGSWSGPIGEKIARAIEQGYSGGAEPYHGFFLQDFERSRTRCNQSAKMDFVVKGGNDRRASPW